MPTTRTTDLIDTLLLLALAAAGKSVIRRYLSNLSAEIVEEDFHLGRLVPLDDFRELMLPSRRDLGGDLRSAGVPCNSIDPTDIEN